MFGNGYQGGLLSIFNAVGWKPLNIFECQHKHGYVRRLVDDDLRSMALEIISPHPSLTFITTPDRCQNSLGIILPLLNMMVKNLGKTFFFEVEVIDDQNMRRLFKIGTFFSRTTVSRLTTTMPLTWTTGWNRLCIHLAYYCETFYRTQFMECSRITIHANCRLRRIFFTGRHYEAHELPVEYLLKCEGRKTGKRGKKENIETSPESGLSSYLNYEDDANNRISMTSDRFNSELLASVIEEDGTPGQDSVPRANDAKELIRDSDFVVGNDNTNYDSASNEVVNQQ